jgi:hypothetical protein
MKYDKLHPDLELASPPALAAARTNKQVFEHAGAARSANFNYADRAVPVRLSGADGVGRVVRRVWGAASSWGAFFPQTKTNPAQTAR